MKLVRVSADIAALQIAESINQALLQGNALLLVSGGSNIDLAVEVRSKLQPANRLTIGLIDERYGPPGHADSNWTKLINAGFDTSDVTLMPILKGESFEATSAGYNQDIIQAFNNHDSVIGVFGIGNDGHTSGVLPGSSAVTSTDMVTCYKADDFSRITTTPASFENFDTAFLVAYGQSKQSQLERLQEDLPISTQPAQALKKAKQLIIYSEPNI
jgi:6-phosphogluconolactonase/glucosamine-6-phosphate isomerase/deaminase